MKNTLNVILICIILSLSLTVRAQLTEGESAYVYSLPKTTLEVELTVVKTVQTPGIFNQYSQRYLATSDVVTENKTTYEVGKIAVLPKTIANPEQTYSLSGFNKNAPAYNIAVNEQGILCGINNPISSDIQELKGCKLMDCEKETESKNASSLLPLSEEYMLAGSTAKLAEGAAKQIYRIRESRLSLLTADVDHMPADGSSFNTMLRRMDKMEKELTELFIGKTEITVEKKVIKYEPRENQTNEVLFRLSAVSGIVPATDLSGVPYYIKLNIDKAQVLAPATKKTNAHTILYCVLPVNGNVVIDDSKKEYYSGSFVFPQFGTVTTLNNDIIPTTSTKVRIDPQTGRLLDIENVK